MPFTPFKDGAWSHFVRYFVALVYLLAPLVYWGYTIYAGMQADMLVWFLVLGISVASAYLVFGRERVDAAFDRVEELQGGDDDADAEDDEDS